MTEEASLVCLLLEFACREIEMEVVLSQKNSVFVFINVIYYHKSNKHHQAQGRRKSETIFSIQGGPDSDPRRR